MKFWRPLSILISSLALTLVSACSPGSLFDNGKDQQVLQTPSYRQVNRNCTGLDLSAPTLTTDETRAVLKCFNAFGALDPLQKLVDKMSDDQLGNFVQAANTYFFKNPALLYELEQTFNSQRTDGSLKTTMQAFSTLLEKPEFVSSLFQILNAQSAASKTKALGIVQSFGAKLDPQTVDQVFTTTLTFTGSKAYRSLVADLHTSQNPKHSLQDLINTGYSVLQDSETPGYSLLDGINQLTKSGDFGTALDTLIGTDEATIRQNIPSYGALFPVLSQNGGEYFQAANGLISALDEGLLCFDRTETGLDPLMDGFEEIAKAPFGQGGMYLQRTHLLRLVVMQPLCTYQQRIVDTYPLFQRMAGSGAMFAIEKSVRYAYNDVKSDGSRPVVEHIRNFLTDSKTFKVSPLMDEFASRGGWQDLMLLLVEPDGADRDRLANTYAFFLDSNSSLDGRSIKDALVDLIVEAGPTKAYNFVSDVSTLVDQDTDWLSPILTTMQTSLDQSGAHPYLDFLRSVMTDAPKNAALFQTLFSMSSQPEFNQSLELLSTLAKDGRLTEILADLVTLMHSHALQGVHPLPPLSATTHVPSPRRHNLSGSDLPPAPLEDQLSPTDPCMQINIGQSPDSQWQLLTACVGDQGGYADMQSAMSFLAANKTDGGKTDLQTIHAILSDLSQDLTTDPHEQNSQADYKSLGDWMVSALDDGSLVSILSGASDVIQRKIIRPVFDLAAPFIRNVKAKAELNGLETYVGQILRSPTFPTVLGEVDRLSGLTPEPPTHDLKANPNLVSDSARLDRWVNNKECENGPDTSARATEIVRDYEEGVTTSPSGGEQAPQFGWTIDELKAVAEPYLAKLADPSQSLESHTLKQSIFNFLHYYSLGAKQKPNALQHETPEFLEQWLYDRTTDQKLTTFYFLGDPPEAAPHVRLVSTIDQIEIVFSNADFDTSFDHFGIHLGINLGKKAMGELADSWGDEPRETWPDEIKEKYRDSNPPTLAQTVDHFIAMLEWMKDAIGFPTLPQCDQTTDPSDPTTVQDEELSAHQGTCQSSGYAGSGLPSLPGCFHFPDSTSFDLRNIKRRLYNLAQAASVLKDNLPQSGTPQDGGIKVLRDLLFQLYYSTPLDSRGQLDGMKNNLSIIHLLVESGITRQFGFEFRRYQRNDPALRSAFAAVMSGANTQEASELFDRLIGTSADSSRDLLWSIAAKMVPYMGNSLADGKVRKDSMYFKQTFAEGLALLQKWNLVEPALKAVNQVLSEGEDSVQTHVENLFELAAQEDISHLVAGLSEDKNSAGKKSIQAIATDFLGRQDLISDSLGVLKVIDSNSKSRDALETMRARWDEFRQSSEYQSLQFGKFTHELLNYFEETPGMSPTQVETARELRVFLAERLENGDLDQLLISLAENPDRSEQVFDTAAHYIDDGSIDALLAFIKLSVNTPARPSHF